MLTITLLDFSSGDLEVEKNGELVETNNPNEAICYVLGHADETPVRLIRAYADGFHDTNVGQLRTSLDLGWWGW